MRVLRKGAFREEEDEVDLQRSSLCGASRVSVT